MTFIAGPHLDSYADTGCSLLPSCLSCPLSVCIHDMSPGKAHRVSAAIRDREKVIAIQAGGLTAKQAAKRFGVRERSIYRIVARHKEIFGSEGWESWAK